MFDTVLVANRGEIAVRVIRTLHSMGIRAVAVYSDADADARHVREADDAMRIGPALPAESYLRIDRIIAAALESRAQAVHPGYGFLSENAAFASACPAEGLVFIGPPPEVIESMGDKIRAKQTVSRAGVPVVLGVGNVGLRDEQFIAAIDEIGFPVLLKPSAGGGGKGMRLALGPGTLPDDIAAARREARGAFGDDTLLAERFVVRPRHVEIQVLADGHGSVVHLGERECSLQRRHQKIIEESPSPLLTDATRAAMGASAVEAARACGYVNAGTVEFIVSADRPDEYFFMEMNTRLQVEHPVTELVTGLDLVELQVRIAAGERLPFGQAEVTRRGHAVEARVYAEDPNRQFLPTGGRVLVVREAVVQDVRVDSSLRQGDLVGSTYDPMLAKVVAWGEDRTGALRRLDRALAATAILGVGTNVGFLRALLAHADVAAGNADTELVERNLETLVDGDLPDEVVVAGALRWLASREPARGVIDPWDTPGGWRVGEPAWITWEAEAAGGKVVEARVRGRASGAEVVVNGGDPVRARALVDGHVLVIDSETRSHRYVWCQEGPTLWLGRGGRAWSLTERTVLDVAHQHHGPVNGSVRSPMPGTVVTVRAVRGDHVVAGQPLLVVEAMKMEHTIAAPMDGVVVELHVAAGQQVAMDQPLAVIDPGGEPVAPES